MTQIYLVASQEITRHTEVALDSAKYNSNCLLNSPIMGGLDQKTLGNPPGVQQD
jgi:hypothetical protein